MWYEGEIGPDTLVWTEGMGRRTRIRDMPTLLGILRGDEDEPAGLDHLLAEAADADHERVADGATTSFGDAALLDAELGSGSSSWELNGGRQRAAAAAAAAGRSSPALVLTLLRELQATQERCEKHEARESALAREEAQARELVRELRALAEEAREARKKENKEKGQQYQVITNTAKIKKMSKKQLRQIKKADTSGVAPKQYGKGVPS